jgi:two-component system nitrate/nitrite response regulator NarL
MLTTASVLLVDDHVMLRKGLRVLLDDEDGLSVVGEASDGLEALDRVRELKPDIVVMDINMPNLNGIDATRQILEESPATRVLALSTYSGKPFVEKMLKVGASGYLLKQSSPEELIQAIRALLDGKGYISADVTNVLLEKMKQLPESGPSPMKSRKDDSAMAIKWEPPPLTAEVSPSAQLIEKLESGRHKKLTLVTASTGSGKTSLINYWLAHGETPSAWLSLEKDDNDLWQFLQSMLAAIHSLHPDACPEMQMLVDAAILPPVSVIAKAMANDLEQIPHPFILALDDYDQIKSKTIQDLVSHLLMGSLYTLHLVIITSSDPLLPLESLLSSDELNELRIQHLHPSVEETANWRETLTNREYEILLLLEQRLRDKEIADQLSISTETVKGHLKGLYRKIDATSRLDAVVKAQRLGFLLNK